MRVLIAGASGLIGNALANSLRQDGYVVSRLVRPGGKLSAGDVAWGPAAGRLEARAIEGVDAVVNLSGASVGEGRWTESRKKILRSSRLDATRTLVDAFAKLGRPPRAFLSASATGFYGDRGDEVLTEESQPGDGFLAALATEWEAAARRAEAKGTRTVLLRFGVVLAREGGALPRMLTPFRLGLGGRLGSGKQWMSWITITDAMGALRCALDDGRLRGPVNVVSPGAVSNAEFTHTLARILRRPAMFPVPATALRFLMGEMANSLLLSSQRVQPRKLAAAGFTFRTPELESALRELLPARN